MRQRGGRRATLGEHPADRFALILSAGAASSFVINL
jgi:hypothetical protein